MEILALKIKFRASWIHSLKEKRMVVKSLIGKLRNKYNLSVSEIEEQDTHQIIVIGIAAIVAHHAQADSILEELLRFMERNTEAEIIKIEKEIL